MNKEYLIKRWLSDELTQAEWEAFKALDNYALYMDIAEGAQHFKAAHFSPVDDFETFNKRLESHQKPVKNLNWLKPLMRIAAVFVVGLGIYFAFFFNTITTIQTSVSEKTTIELPDASVIMLNALSKVQYHKKRWDKEREIKLEGEAFFEVAQGAAFDVITSRGTVTVLGTRFNVKQRGDYFEIKCFEGLVSVSSGDESAKLQAGHTYRILNGIHSQDKTAFAQPQWTKNRSGFKSVPVSEVIAELERQYNIKVVLDGVETKLLFTGSFVHGNLEEALKSITEPMSLAYDMERSNQVRLYRSEQ